MDKRGRSDKLELVVNGKTLKVWLSFELLEKPVLPDKSLIKL